LTGGARRQFRSKQSSEDLANSVLALGHSGSSLSESVLVGALFIELRPRRARAMSSGERLEQCRIL
jgi:hypothetical protein